MASRSDDRTRPRVLAAACLVACLLASGPGCRQAADTRGMNILLITVDTVRADHLGGYGYQRRTTPHLDRLSQKGILFTGAFSHSPWTLPAVASIFTSLPPRDHGITGWGQSLEPELRTIAEQLRDHGYHTEAVVSHYAFKGDRHFDQGFVRYDSSVLRRGNPDLIATSDGVSSLAVEAVGRPLPEPFFLWLHYFDPHTKYLEHAEFGFGSEAVDRYDSEIAFMDHHIGRVLTALEARGLAGRTIIVLVGDHGEEFQDHGGWGHTTTLFNELIRVPLVLAVPGLHPSVEAAPVAISDIAPTLLQLTGVPVPDVFQGRPMTVDAQTLAAPPDRTIVAETLRYADKRAVIRDGWKLIRDRETMTDTLFDLNGDPREMDDRLARNPALIQDLEAVLDSHYSSPRREVVDRGLSKEAREKLQALGYLEK